MILCDQVDGVTSTIIGATNMQQLKENIDAFSAPLSKGAHSDIRQGYRDYPVPV